MGVPCGTVEPGLDLEIDYVTGVTGATDIAFHSDGRAVVTQKGGTVTVRRTDGMQTTLNGKFPNIDAAGEKGLLGVAADPDTDTFYFYVSDGTSTTDKHRVLKGTLTAEHDIVIDGTPVIGATVGNGPGIEGPNNLVGGGLVIHDGYLYVSVGDAGYNAQPPTNKHASCLNKPNGKILRVNLDGSIPNDNPLFGTAMVTSCATPTGAFSMAAPDRRIFAWGLRNPWRFWVDPLTNLLWVGDVGERGREEISVGPSGTHFGWPFYEGTTAYTNLSPMTCAMMSPSKSCTPPVYDYPTDDGASVTGGLIPDGCGWDNVWDGNEYYVWGDWSNDTVHGIQVTSDHAELFVPHSVIDVLPMSFNGPASMRMGPDDSLYIVLNSANAVYRLTPKSRCGPKCTGN
jgi:glucose/arabinose dehydrogenase